MNTAFETFESMASNGETRGKTNVGSTRGEFAGANFGDGSCDTIRSGANTGRRRTYGSSTRGTGAPVSRRASTSGPTGCGESGASSRA